MFIVGNLISYTKMNGQKKKKKKKKELYQSQWKKIKLSTCQMKHHAIKMYEGLEV
jgi:hypothetical protein